MGRVKFGSIIHQMNMRMNSLKRFGQSKHDAKADFRLEQKAKGDVWNPASAPGIYSFKTFDSYHQTSMEFAKWLKQNHPEIKDIQVIDKAIVIQYLQFRQQDGKSAYTISKDMSALNKVLDLSIRKKEANLKERSYKDVTRSRTQKAHDRKYSPDNYKNQIAFAKACGCRRESILGGNYQVKPSSVWQNQNGKLFVSLIEKGGRFRNAPILLTYEKAIREMVPNIETRETISDYKMDAERFRKIYFNAEQPFLFTKYTNKIDNHAFRAEYARARYQEEIHKKESAGKQIKADYRGYDKECVLKVSKSLGHNRPSVVVEHYFR